MTKLSRNGKVVREIETTYQDKPVILTITGTGLTYRIKGHKSPLAEVDHSIAIVTGKEN